MLRCPPISTRTEPLFPSTTLFRSSEQFHPRRSNSTIHVVVDRTSIMTAQAGCDLDCATSVGAQLNQRCACEVVDVFSLHESIRSAFPEFTADPSVHAHLFSPYRSEERRVGKGCVSTVRSRSSP